MLGAGQPGPFKNVSNDGFVGVASGPMVLCFSAVQRHPQPCAHGLRARGRLAARQVPAGWVEEDVEGR